MQITAERVVPVGKQKHSAIWNIECSDLAVLDRQTPRQNLPDASNAPNAP